MLSKQHEIDIAHQLGLADGHDLKQKVIAYSCHFTIMSPINNSTSYRLFTYSRRQQTSPTVHSPRCVGLY